MHHHLMMQPSQYAELTNYSVCIPSSSFVSAYDNLVCLFPISSTVASDCGFTLVGSIPKVQSLEDRGLTNHTDSSIADFLY